MEKLNINELLNRKNEENIFKENIIYFEQNKKKLLTKRGFYIYGAPGAGKTFFVKQLLKKLNYDIVMYDAGDVRNKNVIETITKHNMSDRNVLSMLKKNVKKIAIVMDEIDGMNNGDKGGINSLIKLIRPKKTNKQKKEDTTMLPIICIGNYHTDKKIKEMMKVCIKIEIKKPKNSEIKNILMELMPNLENSLLDNLINYIEGDLRKLDSVYRIYNNQQEILKNSLVLKIFEKKNYNENTKNITKLLLKNKYSLKDHSVIMNETDRTSIGLLYHENIIDYLEKLNINDKEKIINVYSKLLSNITFSDYIDRITFQKQIWIFNEMTSLIKTMYNNYIFSENKKDKEIVIDNEIRFTKVLTKYSTEYNNITFIQTLCNKLSLDKDDLFSYFLYLRNSYNVEEIYAMFSNENIDISKLDIARLYRYLDKYYN